MTAAKYLIVPGRVTTTPSPRFPQRHMSVYLTPGQLMHLWNVDPGECLVAVNLADAIALHERHPHLIILRPRSDGKYDLNEVVPGKTV